MSDFSVSVADSVSVSDIYTARTVRGLLVSDTVSVTDAASTRAALFAIASDTLSVSGACVPTTLHRVSASDTFSLSDTLHVPDHYFASLSDTISLTESLRPKAVHVLGTVDTVSVIELLQVGTLFSAASDGTSLTVQFPTGLRLDRVGNSESYTLRSLNGGVPTMVMSAAPVQNIIASGSSGTIQGSGTVSNQFSTGSTPVNPGNYLTITGRWQTVTARVVSTPILGVAIVDTPLMVDDPNNGHLSWSLLSAVTGVVLTIHEPTGGKSYSLAVSEFLKIDGTPYGAVTTWTASVEGPSILSAQYFENGDVLLTFSDELMVDSALLSPVVYDIVGPTPVEVLGVRTASSTQVILKTTIFGTGTYAITVSQP